jgi:hypothetical protein
MKPKVKMVADSLVAKLSGLDRVEAITANESAEIDVFDPYFALILDVYYRGAVPEVKKRMPMYGESLAIETSPSRKKDRFLINDIPVRVEYKSIEETEVLFRSGKEYSWIVKETGTYPFHRITKSRVLYNRSEWIEEVRKELESLPDTFWKQMRVAFQAKMEHYLSDLGEAVMQNDDFFYLVSAAGFMKYTCTVLFMINKRFEPSHRKFFTQINALPSLPEEFLARWETFLRSDRELTPERKFEVAKLIARSILQLH